MKIAYPKDKRAPLLIRGVFFTGTSSYGIGDMVKLLKKADKAKSFINVTCSRKADAYLVKCAIYEELENRVVVWCTCKGVTHDLPKKVNIIQVPFGRPQLDIVLAARCTATIIHGGNKVLNDVLQFARNLGKVTKYRS